MADETPIAKAKKKLSRRLLDEANVSGVGIRGERIVVYLTADERAVKQRACDIAREANVTVPIVFEVTGEFRKH